MNDRAANAEPSPDAPAVDFDNALAIVGFGQPLLEQSADRMLDECLDRSAATDLVRKLDELKRAMLAHRPRGGQPRPGLWARLLGRDVEAATEAEQLRERIGVLVVIADGHAERVRAMAAEQHLGANVVEDSLQQLSAVVAGARAWLDAHPEAGSAAAADAIQSPRDRFRQRLDQLDSVGAAWTLGLRQMALLREQNLDLLARYQRIRDLLLPVWRQQALSRAGTANAERARAAADAQQAIEAEVAAMAGTLDNNAAD